MPGGFEPDKIMGMGKRLWIPDYIKGWAVIIMIQAHIFETWIRQDTLDTAAGAVIRFVNNIPAAPLFMLLMGYLVYYTRSDSKRLMARGLKVFFWGLLLNIGLNFHYLILILINKHEGNPLQAILGVDILFVAGISLVIIGLIRLLPQSHWWSLLFSVMIAASAPLVANGLDRWNPDNFLQAILGSRAEWSYFPVFPWLSYSLAGYAFAGFLKRYALAGLGKAWKISLMILFLVLGSTGFVFNWNDLKDLEPFYHHWLPVYLWSLSFSLGLTLLLHFLPRLSTGGFPAWIQFAGRYLTKYYVVQWLIIGNLASFYYQQLDLWAYFVGSILVTALTTIIVFVMNNNNLSFACLC